MHFLSLGRNPLRSKNSISKHLTHSRSHLLFGDVKSSGFSPIKKEWPALPYTIGSQLRKVFDPKSRPAELKLCGRLSNNPVYLGSIQAASTGHQDQNSIRARVHWTLVPQSSPNTLEGGFTLQKIASGGMRHPRVSEKGKKFENAGQFDNAH
jgi:hypothetical protein